MNKSLLELKGLEYVELCKDAGYEEWWDYHPCVHCEKPFMEHGETGWRCWPNPVQHISPHYKPMDNLSYVEWLDGKNNSRIS
jgi:hypothetical protein